MGFPGTWMTQSESMIYRVVPKCACSTIGQILYFSDHGRFFEGDIHDAQSGLHKWGLEDSQAVISDRVLARTTPIFTGVRNPYTRILSAFFDKICGIQRNGKRYRGKLLPEMLRAYGLDLDAADGQGAFDQIAAFRRFLLFARDTVVFRKPMDPDIHWSAVSGHVSTLVRNGGKYDHIIWVERLEEGMQQVLGAVRTPQLVDLARVPRFNQSAGHGPRAAHPVEAYFDDLSIHLMQEVYKRDFALFRYDLDNPANMMPLGEIDLDEVHVVLGR